VADTVAQVNDAAQSAASASNPSTPASATSALETLPETLADVDEVVDEALPEATSVVPNQTPASPLAETLETVVEAPITGLPDLGAAPTQQGSVPLVEVNTPVLDLSLQTPAVAEILSGPASSIPAAQSPTSSAASAPANPAAASAPSPGTVATSQADALADTASTTSAPRHASPSAPQSAADPSTNVSPNATPPILEQVEGLEIWASNFGIRGDTGSLATARDSHQSASSDASTSDRPVLSPPRLLPEIARTIGADGWMVPWMAAAFVLATCFASIYIFAVRRS
jgi:hypothetical protein